MHRIWVCNIILKRLVSVQFREALCGDTTCPLLLKKRSDGELIAGMQTYFSQLLEAEGNWIFSTSMGLPLHLILVAQDNDQ